MNIEFLKENAGVLPISEIGLLNIIDDLEDNSIYDLDEFLDNARYGIRAVAALLPPEKYTLLDLVKILEINPSITMDELLIVVEAREEYYGEAGASIIRNLIGLVDDGVRPYLAFKFLRIEQTEAEILEEFLDLEAHWSNRVLDKLHIIILEKGGIQAVQETLNVNKFTAWRLLRWAKKSIPKEWRN
jgi:hypothetical protein